MQAWIARRARALAAFVTEDPRAEELLHESEAELSSRGVIMPPFLRTEWVRRAVHRSRGESC